MKGIALACAIILVVASLPAFADDVAKATWQQLETPGLSRTERQQILLHFSILNPESPHLPALYFKMAELEFGQGSFEEARTWAELASASRDTRIQERAWFLAGVSALRTMDAAASDEAIGLLEKAARIGGPLRLAARMEQATAMRNLGREAQALALYDDILRDPIDAEARIQTLITKGSTLQSLGNRDAENYRAAAQLFGSLAEETEPGSLIWLEIKTRQGKSLEKAGEQESALEAYFAVIESVEKSSSRTDPLWFQKATFSAAELLVDAGDVRDALRVLATLRDQGGQRADEAASRIRHLELTHFILEREPSASVEP